MWNWFTNLPALTVILLKCPFHWFNCTASINHIMILALIYSPFLATDTIQKFDFLFNTNIYSQLVRHFNGLQSLLSTLAQASKELWLLMVLLFVCVLTFSRWFSDEFWRVEHFITHIVWYTLLRKSPLLSGASLIVSGGVSWCWPLWGMERELQIHQLAR